MDVATSCSTSLSGDCDFRLRNLKVVRRHNDSSVIGVTLNLSILSDVKVLHLSGVRWCSQGHSSFQSVPRHGSAGTSVDFGDALTEGKISASTETARATNFSDLAAKTVPAILMKVAAVILRTRCRPEAGAAPFPLFLKYSRTLVQFGGHGHMGLAAPESA